MTAQTKINLLAAALDYAANGWPVVPCLERDRGEKKAKAPYTRHGVDDASTSPEKITRWWSAWPNALIGAAVPATVLVLDIDPRNGGSIEELTEVLGPLPDTLTAWSGRGDGGRHLYFQRPVGSLVSTRLPDGIDLKLRGYCIMPPSPHPVTGEPYRWDGATMLPLPAAAASVLREVPRPKPVFRDGGGDGEPLIKFLHRFPDHGINDALFWAACRAAEAGIIDDLDERLVSTAVALGSPERAARATVKSARRKAGAR